MGVSFDLETRATPLEPLIAARGGLDGGDGRPEEGTSGIPLGPASPGSAVVEALGRAERVGHVAGGKDAGFADGSGLAIMITTVIDTGNGRHDD